MTTRGWKKFSADWPEVKLCTLTDSLPFCCQMFPTLTLVETLKHCWPYWLFSQNPTALYNLHNNYHWFTNLQYRQNRLPKFKVKNYFKNVIKPFFLTYFSFLGLRWSHSCVFTGPNQFPRTFVFLKRFPRFLYPLF